MKVSGTMAVRPDGPVEGTVSDTLLSFSGSTGPTRGEVIVKGDEMSGSLTWIGVNTINLRRKR